MRPQVQNFHPLRVAVLHALDVELDDPLEAVPQQEVQSVPVLVQSMNVLKGKENKRYSGSAFLNITAFLDKSAFLDSSAFLDGSAFRVSSAFLSSNAMRYATVSYQLSNRAR